MEDNENQNKPIDDDILQSRKDIQRIRQQHDSSAEPDEEQSSPAPRIPSYEDIASGNNGDSEQHKPDKDDSFNNDISESNDGNTDANNDTAHAFAELLSGAHDYSDEDNIENEDVTEDSSADTEHHGDHDPLAIIGNAVKMAQLEHPQDDEPAKLDNAATEPDNNSDDSSHEDIDIIDFDDDDDETDDDFEELERQLHELGIASVDDDGPQILQQTPPEPETDQLPEDLIDTETDNDPETLTDEERKTLSADLNDVKELLVQETENDWLPDENVMQFDLADQILAEQRKLAASKRQPPSRKAPSPNIPPATGTVGQVIDENKKAKLETTPITPINTEKLPDTADNSTKPTDISINNCSPAVRSIISNEEELTEFQKQILAELVERDIELHFKDCLKSNSKNYPFKK
ncbi:MAG: hypothetical protein KAS23_10855 [Anaerohalosphaera sp.]|nr:hypothetical protein [Anaerohalosphaera sp.]